MTKPRIRERDTPDIIVLWLAGIIGVVVVSTTAAILFAALTDANINVTKVASGLSDLTTSLIAAVVGYLAGRGVYVGPTQSPPPSPPPITEEPPSAPVSSPVTPVRRPRKG